jgi:energy-coupling factor transporter ATP-binding protein EcfA2
MTIERVIVAGFKSFAERTEVALRPLTILAGANGAGKSTLMQALLLLKQTLESDYDAGPLRIDGPHVAFSQVEQMLWAGPPQRAAQFTLGLHLSSRHGYEATFRQGEGGTPPLEIAQATYVYRDQRAALSLEPSQEQFAAYLRLLGSLGVALPNRQDFVFSGRVQRQGFFLFIPSLTRARDGEQADSLSLFRPPISPDVERDVRGIIHLPGLRGNPQRAYPAAAVGSSFRGPFTHYVAGVIAEWQRRQDGRLSRLNDDLFELGLTSNVRAQPVSDVEFALRVGRTLGAESDDLVDIADTGLGLSQALPVLVALLVAEPGQLVFVEHPELHLHPRAVRALAGPLRRAIGRGVWVVLETHSDLLLISLQEQVARGALRPEDVLLHWVQRDERGASVLHSTTLDANGDWGEDVPVDFEDIRLKAVSSYLKATFKM